MLEKQKEEAILRLKQLSSLYGLNNQVIEDFEKKDLVHCSSVISIYKEYLGLVFNSIEFLKKDKGILPYYIILDPIYVNVLFVGSHKEDWLKERPDYAENMIFAFVFNMEQPEYSEFGSIAIEGCDNAILRIG